MHAGLRLRMCKVRSWIAAVQYKMLHCIIIFDNLPDGGTLR